ncbi:MAG: hypothetical protein Q7R47_05665, partial [Candidatus Diapherotrites archaeon]|nr:hypothetical protein [Candidatus Diapherotrites archaeon]
MNSRAFNLFTALVSFVLIMLAVLMVNTMTRTEERASATIADLTQQSEMQTIADLTRGDAFQIVVFKIRHALEDYFLRDETYAVIDADMDWQQITDNFSCSQLGLCGPCVADPLDPSKCGKTQLAGFVSKNIEGLIYSGSQFGRYEIRPLEGVNQNNFQNAVVKSLESAYDNKIPVPDGAGGTTLEPEVFQLVNCNYDKDRPDAGCPGGTFYVTMDFARHADGSGLSDELYERLPRIVVTDYNVTGAVLKTALIPRAKLRVFVPVRFFQALARAKRIADQTLFKEPYKANLSNMEIGTCNTDDCSVITELPGVSRSPPKYSSGIAGQLSACAGTVSNGLVAPGISAPSVTFSLLGSTISVNANESASLYNGLRDYAKAYLCESSAELFHDETDLAAHENELKLVTDPNDHCVFSKAAFSPTMISRTITYNGTSSLGEAYCATFKSAATHPYIQLEFEEKNPKYMVNNLPEYRTNKAANF